MNKVENTKNIFVYIYPSFMLSLRLSCICVQYEMKTWTDLPQILIEELGSLLKNSKLSRSFNN